MKRRFHYVYWQQDTSDPMRRTADRGGHVPTDRHFLVDRGEIDAETTLKAIGELWLLHNSDRRPLGFAVRCISVGDVVGVGPTPWDGLDRAPSDWEMFQLAAPAPPLYNWAPPQDAARRGIERILHHLRRIGQPHDEFTVPATEEEASALFASLRPLIDEIDRQRYEDARRKLQEIMRRRP